jgi:hypothetical protein
VEDGLEARHGGAGDAQAIHPLQQPLDRIARHAPERPLAHRAIDVDQLRQRVHGFAPQAVSEGEHEERPPSGATKDERRTTNSSFGFTGRKR